ncbi:MAG: hypothetical protein ACRERX_10675 [Pseudomonas sp.]
MCLDLQARDSLDRSVWVEQILYHLGSSVGRINHMAAQIARNIGDIRDPSNEAELTSGKSTEASQRLSKLSSGLAQLLGSFRL